MTALRSLVLGLVATALGASFAAAATWDMPTPYPEGNFHTRNIEMFAKDVKAATDGAVEIRVHSNQSLFKHPEIKNAVRGGQVPLGEILLSRLGNENAVFEADSVPFLATDYDAAEALWRAQRPVVEKLLDREGLMVLFSVPWPPQGLYTKNKTDRVEDLRGVKFRAYNAATERLAQLAGAVPTQVEASEVAQAFATGRVDAMMTSPSTGADSKAWDFVSNYYDVQAWLPKNIVFVNKRAFRALDTETQRKVLEAAAAAETRGWQMSREETTEKTNLLRENGMNVSPPAPALKDGLKAIGETMTEEWAEKAGTDGRAILAAYRDSTAAGTR
jgi:TRAP-type C4-dicarboxylate transport system substrate-binding protein